MQLGKSETIRTLVQLITAATPDLKAGAVYHYRLVATNETGTSHGADATFTAK